MQASGESGKIKICIIGAGPSGLCSLRHILTAPNGINCSVSVFEQQNNVGGIWNYSDPEVKLWDCNGNPAIFPMYNELSCNLPKQLMEFGDFKHKDSPETFLTQEQILDYLMDYAYHFELWPYINLNARVVQVSPTEELQPGSKWIVTVEDTVSYERRTLKFDAVMCCVGVNFYPKITPIPGMNSFKGNVMHSKHFKTVEKFKNKQVVLLGLGPSCADLCLKLATVAKQVVACHRSPGGFDLGLLPGNVTEMCSIARLEEWSVITENEQVIPCDTLILCTGYRTFFPFLDLKEIPISDDGSTSKKTDRSLIASLYKRMLIPKYPNFCFINAHGFLSEFLVMEIQARYFVSLLEGKVILPPQHLMETLALQEEKLLSKQGKLTAALRLGHKGAWGEMEKYLKELAIEGRCSHEFKHIPLHLSVWQWVIRRIFGSLALYRNDEVRVVSPKLWEYICAPQTDLKMELLTVKTFQQCEDGTVIIGERKTQK